MAISASIMGSLFIGVSLNVIAQRIPFLNNVFGELKNNKSENEREVEIAEKLKVTNYENVKPGDIIECKDENGKTFHWFVISEIDDSGKYHGVGGDASGIIGWNELGRTSKWDYEVVWTRYPV